MTVSFLLYIVALDANVLVVPRAGNAEVPDVYLETMMARPTETDIVETQLAIIEALEDAGLPVVSANVLAPDAGRYVPLPALLPDLPPVPRRPREMALGASAAIKGVQGLGTMSGFLAGKTVYVSQAHGFTWYDNLEAWTTQRGNTHDIVEDFVGAEGIDHYLIPMLQNAGATVFPVREPDRQEAMVIVDDADAVLTGVWSAGDAGWPELMGPLTGHDNPFADGGSRIAVGVAGAMTASAEFVPVLPADDTYGVHVSWVQAEDRAPDVGIAIHHAGGVATFSVDQRRHGSTWMYLGRFPFRAETAKIVVTNATASPGSTVSIDAVRFGGGVGVVVRGTGLGVTDGPTSGRPRWEECSRYHAQFCGAPPTVYDASSSDPNDDVGNRSRYAAWQNEEGEDAVYVAWHSNAPSPARGTVTYVYGPNPPDGSYDFTGTTGSDDLAAAVHDEIVGLIHAEWDPAWKDRGIKSAYFGEVNPKHNPEMPATLVEVAFHSTAEDAVFLVEPRFRHTLAQGFYRGIVRYFAERDGIAPEYLPGPPVNLMVTGSADGTISIRWDPPPGILATEYRVYAGRDGFGFDRAVSSSSTEVTLSELGGKPLTPGDAAYVYVTAVNSGGESFPTPTLGASVACVETSARALIVAGFERFDAALLPRVELGVFGLGSPRRLDQDRVNTFAYTVEHGEAFRSLGVPFDSVEAGRVQAGGLLPSDLAAYAVVDWFLGEESTKDETFGESEQTALAAALDLGARLFVSGAEVAWDLDAKGSAADRAFLASRLNVLLESDDAGTDELADGTRFTSGYAVEFPDVLTPQNGAVVLRTYTTGGAALVHHGSVALLGFPFETIDGASARSGLLDDVLVALGVATHVTVDCVEPVTPDESPTPVDDAPEPTAEPDPTLATEGEPSDEADESPASVETSPDGVVAVETEADAEFEPTPTLRVNGGGGNEAGGCGTRGRPPPMSGLFALLLLVWLSGRMANILAL